jgi:glycosyltransferase involved in cell wall biosynthesis
MVIVVRWPASRVLERKGCQIEMKKNFSNVLLRSEGPPPFARRETIQDIRPQTLLSLGVNELYESVRFLLPQKRVFMKWTSLGFSMKPPSVSKILKNFVRSGKQIHRTVVILERDGKRIGRSSNSNKIDSIEDLFSKRDHSKLIELYLPYANRKELIDSQYLYILFRSMMILKRGKEALSVLKNNKEVMVHHKILMFEYIVLCSHEGDSEAMFEGIENCEKRFGDDSIHCKILQALIYSNSNIDEYILKMEKKYKVHAPYEILRAAFATKNKTLIKEYLTSSRIDVREKILQMKAHIFLANPKLALSILGTIRLSSLSPSQAKEVVRISLQLQPNVSVGKFAEKAGMSAQSLALEVARKRFAAGISEGNFTKGLRGLEHLLSFENPTRTQILRLIRTGEDYRSMFQDLLSISGTNGHMLQFVTEFGVKYSFKNISLSALKRLEGLMLCDLDSKLYQKNYVEAVKNSGDLELMKRAYTQLEFIPDPGDDVFDFASYFSRLSSEISVPIKPAINLDESSVEHFILKEIVDKHSSSEPQYKPTPSLVMVVNNSLKFGGAERQVVRCLENQNFAKELVVWNKGVNTAENSFIDDVHNLGVEIFDYSKSSNLPGIKIDSNINHLLDLIPTSPPMNPGISQKVLHLIQLIHDRKPTTLHLWQDSTNILGTIAGLICGVPRIVMSARSLPPFKLPSSSFPHKGPNYYYNNRFVRLCYAKLLQDERVFLCHNSQNGLEKYVEWLGGYEKQMMVMRNGFDLTKFKSPVHIKKPEASFNIGVVFRFVDVKQPILWLNAAKQIIEKSRCNVVFTMIGDGPLLEESIKYSKEIEINNFVEFKGYRDDVIKLLETFDLFMLTSKIEGLPNVLIEAQAMGIPVVSTDAGGAGETFVHGKSGYLVKTSTAEALADAALKVINNSDFQTSSPVIAQAYVKNNFSLEAMHLMLEKILFEGI